jgi:hypothetical protein
MFAFLFQASLEYTRMLREELAVVIICDECPEKLVDPRRGDTDIELGTEGVLSFTKHWHRRNTGNQMALDRDRKHGT